MGLVEVAAHHRGLGQAGRLAGAQAPEGLAETQDPGLCLGGQPESGAHQLSQVDCLDGTNDAAEFALWLSPHILASTGRVLATVVKTPDEEIDEYLQVLAEMAEASGGGLTDPPQTVGDCADWEDNRILDLAAAAGAFLIVSADVDLTSMSPWRGRPIIEPPQFASLVDASRRARRRR